MSWEDDRKVLFDAANILHRRYTPATWGSWGLRIERPPRRIRKAVNVLQREVVAIYEENAGKPAD